MSSEGISRRGLLRGVGAGAALAALPIGASAKSAPTWSGVAVSNGLRPQPGHALAVSTLGPVVLAGGYIRSGQKVLPTRQVQAYDPDSGVAYAIAPLRVPRYGATAVALPNGGVAVIGGYGQMALSSVEIYDPQRNVWEFGEPIRGFGGHVDAVVRYGQLVVTGERGQTQTLPLKAVPAITP